MTKATFANIWKSGTTFTAGYTYFEYERRVGADIVIPFLDQLLDLRGAHVGDFGCHEGGVLAAFREDGRVAGGIGYEVNSAIVDASPFEADERFRIEQRDLLLLDGQERFDLILLLDVLEHVPSTRELVAAVRRSIVPGGSVLVTFPPYWSPFGGHQQIAVNWIRAVPYAHYLPGFIFFSLCRFEDGEYMSAKDGEADMRTIRRTRLSIAKAERAFEDAKLEVVERRLYLLRPEYSLRYGLQPRSAGPLGAVSGLREVVTMGAYYLLRAGRA